MNDIERTNPDISSKYVSSSFASMIRIGHEDPVYRNVYLSPNQGNQAMVCLDEGGGCKSSPQRWEMRSLSNVTRALFDSITDQVRRIIRTDDERNQLTPAVQAAVACLPLMYDEDPERVIDNAKADVTAHLINMRPTV